MQYLSIFILLLITGIKCYPQDILKAGVYKSIEAYRNNQPLMENAFIIEKRTQSDLGWNGGNDYKVISKDPATGKKFIKHEIWAINRDDSLFLNGWRLKLGMWYIKALTQGRYICVEAALPSSTRLQGDLRRAGLYHPTGGIGYYGESYIKTRFLYVCDCELDKVSVLTEETMLKILEADQELLRLFKAERNKDKTVFLKYIEWINKKR